MMSHCMYQRHSLACCVYASHGSWMCICRSGIPASRALDRQHVFRADHDQLLPGWKDQQGRSAVPWCRLLSHRSSGRLLCAWLQHPRHSAQAWLQVGINAFPLRGLCSNRRHHPCNLFFADPENMGSIRRLACFRSLCQHASCALCQRQQILQICMRSVLSVSGRELTSASRDIMHGVSSSRSCFPFGAQTGMLSQAWAKSRRCLLHCKREHATWLHRYHCAYIGREADAPSN